MARLATDPRPVAEASDGLFDEISGSWLLSRVARHCEVTVQAVHRWRLAGVRDASGQVVKLQCVRVGHRWRTRREWVAEFFARLSGESVGQVVTTPHARARDVDRAEAACAAAGI